MGDKSVIAKFKSKRKSNWSKWIKSHSQEQYNYIAM